MINMNWINKCISSIFIILLSISFSLVIFVLFDFTYNYFTKQDVETCEILRDKGFYELKPNCNGTGKFYSNYYPIFTDQFGFRIKSFDFKGIEKASIIFLGDSFTFGINGSWDQSFVGMFEKKTNLKVINAGLASYSPTVYVYQYKKALKADILSKPHDVIVAIDISDVQDQAGFWERGDKHPIKMKYSLSLKGENSLLLEHEKESGDYLILIRSQLKKALPFTRSIYHYIKTIGSEKNVLKTNTDLPRSAFTHVEWSVLDQYHAAPDQMGYLPLGVEKGLTEVVNELREIKNIAQKNNGRVILLIYPWPAQMIYEQSIFSWNNFIISVCKKIECDGVIDTFNAFKISQSEGVNLNDIFQLGDVHFTEFGNQILVDELISSYEILRMH